MRGRYYDGARAGAREHALPLVFGLFPRRVLAANPAVEAALCVNQRRLVSPFDVHATLLHLVSFPAPPRLPDWTGAASRVAPRSLLEPVPANRACASAGVKPEDCGKC